MKDLFEHYKELPLEVISLTGDMYASQTEKWWDYSDCKEWKLRFEAYGYTFDYGLDAEPYNLRKL